MFDEEKKNKRKKKEIGSLSLVGQCL